MNWKITVKLSTLMNLVTSHHLFQVFTPCIPAHTSQKIVVSTVSKKKCTMRLMMNLLVRLEFKSQHHQSCQGATTIAHIYRCFGCLFHSSFYLFGASIFHPFFHPFFAFSLSFVRKLKMKKKRAFMRLKT